MSTTGGEIDGENNRDQWGAGLAISRDGSRVAGGAISNNDNLQSSGHVRVYEYPSAATGWTQVGADIDGTGFRDESGHACALSDDGSFLVIGAWKHDGPQGADSGEVRTFSYDTASASWQQLFNQALYGRQAGARFGKSLSSENDVVSK